jgi:hypothetical protein
VTLQGSLLLCSNPPHPHRLHRLTKRVAVGSARISPVVLCQPYLFVKTSAKPTRGLLGQTTLARRRHKTKSVVHNLVLIGKAHALLNRQLALSSQGTPISSRLLRRRTLNLTGLIGHKHSTAIGFTGSSSCRCHFLRPRGHCVWEASPIKTLPSSLLVLLIRCRPTGLKRVLPAQVSASYWSARVTTFRLRAGRRLAE